MMLQIESTKLVKMLLNSFAEGDELKMMLMGLKRFTKHSPLQHKICISTSCNKSIEKRMNIAINFVQNCVNLACDMHCIHANK